MKSYSFSLLFAALFVAGVSAQLTVNTPLVFLVRLIIRVFSTPFSGRMWLFAPPLPLPGPVARVRLPFFFSFLLDQLICHVAPYFLVRVVLVALATSYPLTFSRLDHM